MYQITRIAICAWGFRVSIYALLSTMRSCVRYLDFPFSALVTPLSAISSKTVIAEFGPFSIITLPDNISYVDENKNHRGTPTMHLLSLAGVAGKVLVDDRRSMAEIANAQLMGSSSNTIHMVGVRIVWKAGSINDGEHIFPRVISEKVVCAM
jgi:hypothetical protein